MTRFTIRRSLVAMGAVSLLTTGLFGAKPPKEQPATVTFRCAANVPCATEDGIRGDGDGSVYSAKLDASGNVMLALFQGGGRSLWLDFTHPSPTYTCGPGTCRRTFSTLLLGDAGDVIFHTSIVDPSGAQVPGGIKSIPVGGWSYSRLRVAFNSVSAGQEIAWAVRFNPDDYPGSVPVLITRTAPDTWEIEAGASDPAILASEFSRVRPPGSSLQTDGPFFMPFKAKVVTAP